MYDFNEKDIAGRIHNVYKSTTYENEREYDTSLSCKSNFDLALPIQPVVV